jgi:hypothetical protein
MSLTIGMGLWQDTHTLWLLVGPLGTGAGFNL